MEFIIKQIKKPSNSESNNKGQKQKKKINLKKGSKLSDSSKPISVVSSTLKARINFSDIKRIKLRRVD